MTGSGRRSSDAEEINIKLYWWKIWQQEMQMRLRWRLWWGPADSSFGESLESIQEIGFAFVRLAGI
jgi:hypothetical protein